MNKSNFLRKYESVLFDSKGRINANIRKMKIFDEIESNLKEITSNYPVEIDFRERLSALRQNYKEYPTCESCGKPSNYTAGKFTPFCSFKCSRKAGSSTFTKAQATCIERYGVKSNLAMKENFDKIKQNNGGIGSASKKIKEKIEQTNIKKYGCKNVWSSKDIIEKVKQTHIQKYGGNFHTVKLGKKLNLLENKEWCTENAKKFNLNTISEMIGVASNTVIKYFEKHGITTFNRQKSTQEKEIYDFIKSLDLNLNIIQGHRTQIKPFELDLYIPSLNFAIELNGLYWHSDLNGTSRLYHLNKTKMCEKLGIQLFQIFENEWITKNEIVKSKIKTMLGLNSKIFARKCEIVDLCNKDKNDFLNKNHLQGACPSSVNYGLSYENELVSIMTFGKSRFDRTVDFELLRFCNKQDINVIGGFSKLLNKFLIENGNNKSLITFADRRWSKGDVYIKNNFELVDETSPAYFYFKNSSIVLENRQSFQKHKLNKKLNSFDPNLSEWENMKINGYNRIWDCGNLKFRYSVNKHES